MRTIVAVVICVLLAVPVGASASGGSAGPLLRRAAKLSGLPVRRPVATATVAGSRYDVLLARALSRDYPSALQRIDTTLYTRLGLINHSVKGRPPASRAWYDPSEHKLLLRRTPMPGQALVVNELVRALVDQNYGLGRVVGLRSRDRDRALAAKAIVDGTAALASGLHASPLSGTPLERFQQLEVSAGLGPGRALAAELRYLGGRAALATALRTFPQTTEQLLHVDKFLEREPALPVRLPSRIGDATLTASETFGELDVRSLLQAFGIPDAATIAAGWGGGRLVLYTSGEESTAALVLRWDTTDDAAEWRDAVGRYVAAAFPGAGMHECPPLDRCWSGTTELAAGVLGETSVFASGPGSQAAAAALLHQP